MVKKLLLIIATLALLLVPLASAANVELKLHTLPIHEVNIYILDPSPKYQSLQSFTGIGTGFKGLATVNFSMDKSEFGLFAIVKKDGETIFSERLDNQQTQAIVDVYVLTEEGEEFGNAPEAEEISEETNESEIDNAAIVTIDGEDEKTEEVIEEETNKKDLKDITGGVISNNGENKTTPILFIAIGIVLFVLITSFIIYRHQSHNHPALKTDNRPATILADNELEDAERRIKLAEKEIKNIRAQNEKRAAAQKKFLEAKKELEEAESSSGNDNSDETESDEEKKE